MNAIRRLLDGVVADLSQPSGRAAPLRFLRYSLAVWLASLITNHTAPHRADDPLRCDKDALPAFFNGMRDKCEGSYPDFLGGDSVARFALTEVG